MIATKKLISKLLKERADWARLFDIGSSRVIYNPLLKLHINGYKKRIHTLIPTVNRAEIMDYEFVYDSWEYEDCINYEGQKFYNPPLQLHVNDVKIILPFGTSDRKSIHEDGDTLYIVAENAGLNYISMVSIEFPDNIIHQVYLTGDDLDLEGNPSYGLLDKGTEEQIKILNEYINY